MFCLFRYASTSPRIAARMSLQPASGTYDIYQQCYHRDPTTYHPVAVTNCKLCGQTAIQPTYLRCKHVFCYVCLHTYVVDGQYLDSLDFPCPHCHKLSAPPWGIWHLSHKVCPTPHLIQSTLILSLLMCGVFIICAAICTNNDSTTIFQMKIKGYLESCVH